MWECIKTKYDSMDGDTIACTCGHSWQICSLASNRKMWACLGDIAKQVQWPVNGFVQFLSAEDWKDILSASLKKEGRMAQGIDGGFVMLGQRTSKMKVKEMCDLIEIIYAFGANNGVVWSESVPDEYLEFSRMTNEKS
jgi:hypothetical protein